MNMKHEKNIANIRMPSESPIIHKTKGLEHTSDFIYTKWKEISSSCCREWLWILSFLYLVLNLVSWCTTFLDLSSRAYKNSTAVPII